VGPWTVVERESGAVVGRAGLWDEPDWPGVEAVWFIGRPWWGKGYATEAAIAAVDWAFANRPIDEVVSVIVPANSASVRVAERLGMRADRVEFLHGSDHTIYVINRSTWEKRSDR
jgi:RimJ/RimL family protein N-acetyltransferase